MSISLSVRRWYFEGEAYSPIEGNSLENGKEFRIRTKIQHGEQRVPGGTSDDIIT